MKELYRHKDYTTVAYYKSILESEGIPQGDQARGKNMRSIHRRTTDYTDFRLISYPPHSAL